MATKLFYVGVFLASCSVTGQQLQRSSIGMSGQSTTVNRKYVSESVGQQSVLGTFATNNHVARQGFQQPLLKITPLPQEYDALNAVLFPNPAVSIVHIQFYEELDNPVEFSLYDNSGRLVRTAVLEPSVQVQIDVTGIASGSYIVRIVSGNKSLQAKLLKY
ncbi:T9SS type A sorting domain-containing protein [Altibacter sp. HG106]|uniref:T9SS type A sorting domain-containing protein n=1 Tax=Altibacter sp. HG106 TaxID=3023937 RepID=UPI00234FF1D4|nr:T9SS type A sorting domain-containing protein [Altibacter sp. HG106]MDC7995102.1 T9SS type A sorting domain-containing protein [Altibacter sp. HG106]